MLFNGKRLKLCPKDSSSSSPSDFGSLATKNFAEVMLNQEKRLFHFAELISPRILLSNVAFEGFGGAVMAIESSLDALTLIVTSSFEAIGKLLSIQIDSNKQMLKWLSLWGQTKNSLHSNVMDREQAKQTSQTCPPVEEKQVVFIRQGSLLTRMIPLQDREAILGDLLEDCETEVMNGRKAWSIRARLFLQIGWCFLRFKLQNALEYFMEQVRPST